LYSLIFINNEDDIDAMIDAFGNAAIKEGYSAIGAGPEATAAGGLIEDKNDSENFMKWASDCAIDRTATDGQIHYTVLIILS